MAGSVVFVICAPYTIFAVMTSSQEPVISRWILYPALFFMAIGCVIHLRIILRSLLGRKGDT